MFCNAPQSNKFGLCFLSLFIIFSRHNCHLLISIGFELLCNVCYWKFLLIVFVVRLHHQASLSCGAKVLFFKTWISVVFSTVFLKKIENHKFSFSFSFLVPNMSHFFENGSIAVLPCILTQDYSCNSKCSCDMKLKL